MSLDETATTQSKGQGLLKSYRPFPGVSDELLDAAGRVRPVWQPFIDHLSSLTPEQINDLIAYLDTVLPPPLPSAEDVGTDGMEAVPQ